MKLKQFIKKILPPWLFEKIKKKWFIFLHLIFKKSINQALCEQGLTTIYYRLVDIVPDISDQYNYTKLDNEYSVAKVRGMHAFQIFLVEKAIALFRQKEKEKRISIVDIGDSAGTHIKYIEGMVKDQGIHGISVNLDEKAIQKIRGQGLNALCMRAENLAEKTDIKADIFLSFEMLEHLMNPVAFLHSLADKTNCELFVATVPYLKCSRVGLHNIRSDNSAKMNAENTHIFELSFRDWQLLFKLAGWHVVFERIYFQYPKKHLLRITQPLWKAFDFEGFYGAILTRDSTYSDLYQDW